MAHLCEFVSPHTAARPVCVEATLTHPSHRRQLPETVHSSTLSSHVTEEETVRMMPSETSVRSWQNRRKSRNCHQCKRSKYTQLLRCMATGIRRMSDGRSKRCNKQYCSRCISRYGDNISALVESSSGGWLCYSCRSQCQCSACREDDQSELLDDALQAASCGQDCLDGRGSLNDRGGGYLDAVDAHNTTATAILDNAYSGQHNTASSTAALPSIDSLVAEHLSRMRECMAEMSYLIHRVESLRSAPINKGLSVFES